MDMVSSFYVKYCYVFDFVDYNDRHGEEGCSYFFDIDSYINDMSRLVEGQVSYVIDATRYGNVSRFINHR